MHYCPCASVKPAFPSKLRSVCVAAMSIPDVGYASQQRHDLRAIRRAVGYEAAAEAIGAEGLGDARRATL